MAIIGTQSSTINCINGLKRKGYVIDLLISLPQHLSGDVADYQNLSLLVQDEAFPVFLVDENLSVNTVTG